MKMKRRIVYFKVLVIAFVLACGMATVNVQAKANKAISFNTKKVTMYASQKKMLKVKKSAKYKDAKILYTSSNSKIVKVTKKGRIKGIAKGKAKITAQIKGTSKKAKIRVTVLQNVKSIKLEQLQGKYFVGKKYQLKAVTVPSVTDERIKWKSSDKKIASIRKNGLLTIKKEGNVTITAYSSKTKEKKSVNIETEYEPEIKFQEGKTKTVEYGTGLQLHIQYINHKTEVMTFSTSDSSIATVTQTGYVQTIRPGDVYITATTADQKEKITIKIVIEAKTGFMTKLMLDNMDLDNYTKLMIVAHPDDETLWGGGHLQEGNWLVVCLTNQSYTLRKNEFKSAMNMLGQKGIILDYPDLQKNIDGKNVKNLWGNVKTGMEKDLNLVINYKQWDQIVTHNPMGEYGHIHHIMTNNEVTSVCSASSKIDKLWYFGQFFEPGKVPEGLTRISDEWLQKKEEVLKTSYKREQWSIPKYWAQMNPYENWTPAQ